MGKYSEIYKLASIQGASFIVVIIQNGIYFYFIYFFLNSKHVLICKNVLDNFYFYEIKMFFFVFTVDFYIHFLLLLLFHFFALCCCTFFFLLVIFSCAFTQCRCAYMLEYICVNSQTNYYLLKQYRN